MTTLCVADLVSRGPFDRILSHREQLNEHSGKLKMVTISVDDRLLAAYLFYGGILLLKMLSMSLITAFYRIKNKVCDNPEFVMIHLTLYSKTIFFGGRSLLDPRACRQKK